MAPRPGEGPAELVFVSYSHKDAVWVQRFEVLFKPLLRKRRLQLWVDDAALRAGDEWRAEIDAAIARSTAALLLVSGDFLASDFVMEKELPALERHGVRLLPVLVGDCLWDEEPTLEERQWLHDPGRDGPLGRDAADTSRRDERMVAMCRKLVAALPGRPADGPAPTTTTTAGSVAAVPEGTAAGELSDVPDAPPGYVVRDELAALIEAVTAVDTGAVGVTAAVGLLGQSGIGKSVLAAALGRNETIRRRFPDGVFWVTVGERADVLAIQLDLLTRLGAAGTAPRTIYDATTQLRELLRERRVLLLVDDVWSDATAHAFRVTGPQSRVVYTTRDQGIVAAVGARELPIDVLSVDAARAVAAAVIDTDPAALPDAANRAFDEVDRVALAVALLAAAVRGGRSWHKVADSLRGEVDVYGDHPYANTFKAMQIAIAALPPDLGSALLSLAVFPPDTAIPVAAVERYWAHIRPAADSAADLDLLAVANVLRRDGDTIGFHDLQHDYLLLHSPGLATMHADLLGAYRALLPTDADGWWALPPDEPYVWDHLATHLVGAGDRRALAATVTDPAYLARRIAGSGLHAAEADLAQAAEVLSGHRTIDWWRRWIAQHAEFFAGSALAESASPTMRAWLRADPSRRAEVDPDRLAPLLTSPYLEVRWGLVSPQPALERALAGHHGLVRTVDWSPDGARIASASDDGTVRLWNPDTGRTVDVIRAAQDRVAPKVAWSPDGRLALVTHDGRVRVYDESGRVVRPVLGGTNDEPDITERIDRDDGVRAIAWSPDGRLTIVTRRGAVWLCDPHAPEPARAVDVGAVTVQAVAWSPDGRRAVASTEGTVRINGPEQAALNFGRVEALAWSPDGTQLAVCRGPEVVVWRPVGSGGTVLTGHTQIVEAVAWSPGGRLASGARDRAVRIWDMDSARSVVLAGHTDWVRSVAWAPDGARLVSGGDDGMLRIWRADARHSGAGADRPAEWVRAVALAPGGRCLATLDGDPFGSSNCAVRLWDAETGAVVTADLPTDLDDSTLMWSADARFLVVDGEWHARRWEQARDRTTEIGPTEMPAGPRTWTRNGDGFAVVTVSGIEVWNDVWDGGRHASTIRVPDRSRAGDTIDALAWPANASRIAVKCSQMGATTTTITVLEAGRAPIELTRTGSLSGTPAFAPDDDTRLAISDGRSRVIVWHLETGATTELDASGSVVTAFTWSPDGTRIVTASDDDVVTVYDVDGTFRTRLRLPGATCVAWEGTTIAVGRRNGPAVLELREPGD